MAQNQMAALSASLQETVKGMVQQAFSQAAQQTQSCNRENISAQTSSAVDEADEDAVGHPSCDRCYNVSG